MSKQSDDFAPLPTFKESVKSTGTWVTAVTTKIEGNGTVTQVSTIIPVISQIQV